MDHRHERKQEQIEELTLSSRWFRDGWKVTNWPVLSISVFCFQYWGQHDHHHHHHHHYQHDHHHHQWWFTSTTITITLLRAEEKKTWPMTILIDIWCLPMFTNIWPGIKQRPASIMIIFQHNYCKEKFLEIEMLFIFSLSWGILETFSTFLLDFRTVQNF